MIPIWSVEHAARLDGADPRISISAHPRSCGCLFVCRVAVLPIPARTSPPPRTWHATSPPEMFAMTSLTARPLAPLQPVDRVALGARQPGGEV
jgi:hypothetical protein